MIKSNSTTASVVNLDPSSDDFPSEQILNLCNSVQSLTEYADYESDNQIIQLIAQSCRKSYLDLLCEIKKG